MLSHNCYSPSDALTAKQTTGHWRYEHFAFGIAQLLWRMVYNLNVLFFNETVLGFRTQVSGKWPEGLSAVPSKL